MTDPVPSKEQAARLLRHWAGHLATWSDAALLTEYSKLWSKIAEACRNGADEIESARRTAEHWKAEHLAGNAEIERLRTTLTGISTCSTCEVCRGAAKRALAPPPEVGWDANGSPI